jgi:hypothetical protein
VSESGHQQSTAGQPSGKAAETTYRGIRWRRDARGRSRFFDADRQRWVAWGTRVDAPPLPPGWGTEAIARPSWRTPWRIVPVVLIVVALVIAVTQALDSGRGNQVTKETKASAALLGRCLQQDGTLAGHPKYLPKSVSCTSAQADAKVVAVLTSTPGSPLCPSDTVGMELPYDVPHPHIECVQPLHA